jgi:(p)ppGpp synthase/HD superfamily hydrolase
MEKLSEAISVATLAHEGQFDKAGMPYILHPFRVMQRLHNQGHSEELLVAAILHDTVEDTNITIEEIEEQFGAEVARIVAAVSREDETYMEFIARVKMAGNKAIALKLADIEDNTDLRRPRIEHLAERYAKAKELLLS